MARWLPAGGLGRVWNSAVVWSWAFNGLRLGSAILLLPLLLKLPPTDFGYYYLLLQIIALVPLIDFGLWAGVERAVSYAMGGATALTAHGVPPAGSAAGPNFGLIWKLLHTARFLYRWLSLVLLCVLGSVGTLLVYQAVGATSSPTMAWCSWLIALLNAVFEVYSGWWAVLLRSMNRVTTSSRILVAGHGLKLLLSYALLLSGGSLMSVFAAGFVSSYLIRALARRSCLRLLPREAEPKPTRAEVLELAWKLWPNSWRIGGQLFSSYLLQLFNTYWCLKQFGLASNGQYGLSLQVVGLVHAMSSVWVVVKWPKIGQLRAQNDYPAIRRILRQRLWLQAFTFAALALPAATLGPWLLDWSQSGKQLLLEPWFALLLLNGFLEGHMISWGTFLTTGNRVPTFWPILLANGVTLVLVAVLTVWGGAGLGAFALAPLLTGLLFNYWFWPKEGAFSLETSWLRFMFFSSARRARQPGATP